MKDTLNEFADKFCRMSKACATRNAKIGAQARLGKLFFLLSFGRTLIVARRREFYEPVLKIHPIGRKYRPPSPPVPCRPYLTGVGSWFGSMGLQFVMIPTLVIITLGASATPIGDCPNDPVLARNYSCCFMPEPLLTRPMAAGRSSPFTCWPCRPRFWATAGLDGVAGLLAYAGLCCGNGRIVGLFCPDTRCAFCPASPIATFKTPS